MLTPMEKRLRRLHKKNPLTLEEATGGWIRSGKPLWEAARESKTLNLREYHRFCLECHKEFIAHRKDKLFCCSKCYQAYYYREYK
jgi:protein-arginine kinase activator protein McsA